MDQKMEHLQWLHRFVSVWAGPQGRVLALSWQNRGSPFPERDLTFRGRITVVRDDEVALDVWEEDDTDPVLMPATARVRLPRRL